MKLWTALLAATLVMASMDADAARRLGGGKSVGQQSSNVTQRQATQQPPATLAQKPAAQQAPAAQPTPAPAAAAPKRPWGAMLGGLAAGLGLAWLAHSLGLGEAFGNVLMVILLAMVVMAVIGLVMRSRRGGSGTAAQRQGGFAYAGAGATADSPSQLPQYNPAKVGNDASARPWESTPAAFEAPQTASGSGLRIGSALEGSQTWGIPAGFDVDGFVSAAKRNFITLQDAWDRSDIPSLRSMMTDEMLVEIKSQLAEREAHTGGQVNKTEVVMLEAQLLGIEELADHYLASVEFSGMIREDASAGPSPFREVWNMSKPKSGASGWLVAGVQALQ